MSIRRCSFEYETKMQIKLHTLAPGGLLKRFQGVFCKFVKVLQESSQLFDVYFFKHAPKRACERYARALAETWLNFIVINSV